MGILDDAIREHLELKRQHGAGDEDLERLENEAFGPAARPGDPEFATGEEPAVATETGEVQAVSETAAEPEESAAPAAEPASEELATEPPSEEAAVAEPPSEEQPAAEPPAEESPSGSFGIFDAESEFGEGETPAERARVEYADLDDTADHPAPTQLGPESEAEPVPSEPAPSAEAPAADDATEIDATEAIEPEAAEPAAAPAEEAAPEAPEADIFSEDEDFGLADMDLSIEEESGSGSEAAKPAASEGEGADGEDLLEETPDFLQESEGEDLWFEQGPPRDFDFDDD